MKIQLNEVGKRYKYTWILHELSLTLASRSNYAVTGPNGSGKSTFLKLLSGYLSPSKGQIDYFDDQNNEVTGDQIYQSISFAAPYIDLIEAFTLQESLSFHQQFKAFLPGWSPQKIIDFLALPIKSNQPIKHYSSGMMQRLKLAMASFSKTPILLLDEPTTNLDQQGVEWYLELIDLTKRDRLLVVASNVEEDYAFCDEKIHILDYKIVKKQG